MGRIGRTPSKPGREREECTHSSQIGRTLLTTMGGLERLAFNESVNSDPQQRPDQEAQQAKNDRSQQRSAVALQVAHQERPALFGLACCVTVVLCISDGSVGGSERVFVDRSFADVGGEGIGIELW